jgi:hypothetical protein
MLPFLIFIRVTIISLSPIESFFLRLFSFGILRLPFFSFPQLDLAPYLFSIFLAVRVLIFILNLQNLSFS